MRLRKAGLADVPVIVGGIIPPDDADMLIASRVRRVYTPKDFDLNAIIGDIADVVGENQPHAFLKKPPPPKAPASQNRASVSKPRCFGTKRQRSPPHRRR